MKFCVICRCAMKCQNRHPQHFMLLLKIYISEQQIAYIPMTIFDSLLLQNIDYGVIKLYKFLNHTSECFPHITPLWVFIYRGTDRVLLRNTGIGFFRELMVAMRSKISMQNV